MRKNLLYLFLLFVHFFVEEPLSARTVDYPQWVLTTVSDDMYYYGVGMAYKQKKSTAHVLEAEQVALQKISENISLTVQSNTILVEMSADEQTRDDLSSIIQVRTANDVQGYEKIEIFETKKEYWVLMRLSKALYAENERVKHQRVVEQAKRQLEQAIYSENISNIPDAIVGYAKTIDHLKAYFTSENYAYIDGQRVNILSYAYNKLKYIIPKVSLKSAKNSYSSVQGKDVDSICCEVRYDSASISNVFVKAYIPESNLSDIVSSTGLDGRVYFRFPPLKAALTNSQVEFSLDLNSLFDANSVDYVIRRWLSQIYSEKASARIEVVKANVFVNIMELNIGDILGENMLGESFKQIVRDLSYNVVDSVSMSDYVIDIRVLTEKDYMIDGLYFARLKLKIDVRESSGRLLYSEDMPQLRGVHTTLRGAGMNAYYQLKPQIEKKYKYDIEQALQGY